MKYDRKWWSAVIPKEWEVKENRGKVTFLWKNSKLQVNAAEKAYGNPSSVDLLDFMSDTEKKDREAVKLDRSQLSGFKVCKEESNIFLKKWFLFRSNYIFIIKYEAHSDGSDEIRKVEDFLLSIKFKEASKQ
jgi:hypothetical protein